MLSIQSFGFQIKVGMTKVFKVFVDDDVVGKDRRD